MLDTGEQKRNRADAWQISGPMQLSDWRYFEKNGIYNDKLYDDCIIRFTPAKPSSSRKSVDIGFLLSATGYNIAMSNSLMGIKTTSGNSIGHFGVSPGSLSLSLVLFETSDCQERYVTLTNIINMASAHLDVNGYNSLYSAAIIIEGFKYYGVFGGYSLSKSAANPYSYTLQLSFSFFTYEALRNPDMSAGGIRKDIIGLNAAKNGVEDSHKVWDYSFTPNSSIKTDADSLINDSTMSDSLKSDVSDKVAASKNIIKVIKSDNSIKRGVATVYPVYKGSDTSGGWYGEYLPLSSGVRAYIDIGVSFSGYIDASSVDDVTEFCTDKKIYTAGKTSTGLPLSDFVYISDTSVIKYVDSNIAGTKLANILKNLPSSSDHIHFLIRRVNCQQN